jgi:hypothetical protein
MKPIKKYSITIEETHTEHHKMNLDGVSAMNVLDEARKLITIRNKKAPVGTVYSVKKVEELKDE